MAEIGSATFEAGTTSPPRLLGIGWATVDLDRAASLIEPRPAPAAEDELLGARTALAAGTPWIVLLEPNTEGRIAASLVRGGEGPAAIYVGFGRAGGPGMSGATPGGPGSSPGSGGSGLAAHLAALSGSGIRFSSPGDGPFGPAVLVAGGEAWGPHLLLVEADAATSGTATIRP